MRTMRGGDISKTIYVTFDTTDGNRGCGRDKESLAKQESFERLPLMDTANCGPGLELAPGLDFRKCAPPFVPEKEQVSVVTQEQKKLDSPSFRLTAGFMLTGFQKEALAKTCRPYAKHHKG